MSAEGEKLAVLRLVPSRAWADRLTARACTGGQLLVREAGLRMALASGDAEELFEVLAGDQATPADLDVVEFPRQVGISPTSVHRIWRAFGLQPWRTEDFKISLDPLLIDKIRDVAGLDLTPPANAAVFAVDDKPQIRVLERTAPVLPMIPGVPERRSRDYTRHGTRPAPARLSSRKPAASFGG